MATAKPVVATVKVEKRELPGEWSLKPISDKGTAEQWLESFKAGCLALLQLASKEQDVLNIFTVNRPLFDRAKELDKKFYEDLMSKFSEARSTFKKEK